MTHLGSRVSALIDGRLAPEEEERCWAHVHGCHACRDLVEQEGWVKTQLAQLSLGPSPTSRDLKSSLLGSCPSRGALAASPFPTALPTAAHRSRRGLVAIGGGAASACVVGMLALGVAQDPRIEPRPPTTDLTRPSVTREAGSPSRTPLAERLVAIREKIAP